jgi:CelD/BcsL family acetyltransferase involved in cellulose biosynthesis
VRFTWVTRDEELDGLREEWTLLDDGDGPQGVFRSWEWLVTWWRVLGRARRRQLRVLVARDDDGRPRGILPMYLESKPVARIIPRRRLRLLGDLVVGSDYLGLVAPRADVPHLAPRFAEHVATDPELAAADLVELQDLLHDDALAEELPAALEGAGFVDVTTRTRYRCPYAAWGDDLDGYLARRPQKFGSQIRNRRRELSKKSGFRLEVIEEPGALVEGLEHLFYLHRTRWAEAGGSEAFPDERTLEFHRRSGRLLAARGLARLALLSLEGRPVAAGYGFLRGRRFSYYQAGLDPEWRKRSAGMVVMVELMRHAAAAGAEELDFLRGDEPYKEVWSTNVRRTVAVSARRATASARRAARAVAVLDELRARIKATIPEPALGAMRRFLRGMDGT